jgi:hypothetical protein
MCSALVFQQFRQTDRLSQYDSYHLPAFDAHVYVAMGEHPSVFTLPPWGYRILGPWIVHLFSPADVATGFVRLTHVSLLLAGVALFLFSRRLGHRLVPCWLGVIALGLSPGTGQLVGYPFLVDAPAFALELAFLLALESGAGVAGLTLIALAGALTKETSLVFLPLVYLARHVRIGKRRALTELVLVASPALLITAFLRWGWAGAGAEVAASDSDRFASLLGGLVAEPGAWAEGLLYGGLMPLALLGGLRRCSRDFLRRYGWVLVCIPLPLANPHLFWAPHLLGDLPRYLLYATPALIPLGLAALDRAWPGWEPPSPPRRQSLARTGWAIAGTLVLVSLMLLAQDPYRRVELSRRDGRYVLTLIRQTLGSASRLARGKPVIFTDIDQKSYSPALEPQYMDRMRWFLLDGWGHEAHYSYGPVVTASHRAGLLIPCLESRDLDVVLRLSANEPGLVGFRINGQPLDPLLLGTLEVRHSVRLPADTLFRGDNRLDLTVSSPRRIRLHSWAIRPVS